MLANKGDYPGLYQGALGKWQKKLAEEQKWARMLKHLPKMAGRKRQTPRWLLRQMEVAREGSGRKPGKLPLPVMEVAEGILLKQLELGAEITVPAVAQLLGSAVEVWNEEVGHLQKQRAEAEAALEQRRQELVEEAASKERLEEVLGELTAALPATPEICKAAISRSSNSLYKHAEKFLRKFDFQVHTVSKPGKHLRQDAPQVQAVKEYVAEVIRCGQAHPLLIANFDQVWTTMHLRTSQPRGLEGSCPTRIHPGRPFGEWSVLSAAAVVQAAPH